MAKRNFLSNALVRQLQLKTDLIQQLQVQVHELQTQLIEANREAKQNKRGLDAEVIRNTEILRRIGSINNDHRMQMEGIRHDVVMAERAFEKKDESYRLLKAKHDELNRRHNKLQNLFDERDKHFNTLIEVKNDEIGRLHDAMQVIEVKKPNLLMRAVHRVVHLKAFL